MLRTGEGRNQLRLPSGLQQKCLDIFRGALNPRLEDRDILQEVKGHLYNRNFSAAFSQQGNLRVYASRWSPSRALGYVQILCDLRPYVLRDRLGGAEETAPSDPVEVVCLGGGAGSELVGTACWFIYLREYYPGLRMSLKLFDIADWNAVITSLHDRLVKPPELSKYASAAVSESSSALVSLRCFAVSFQQQDVLEWSENAVFEDVGRARLVTLMFTLNELYSTSVPRTQKLLASLSSAMSGGSLLLVVDSPGSYSTVTINGAERKYPMHWLLDVTLLGSPGRAQKREAALEWEKLETDESRWFRLPSGLQYPIELENMRYQIHLFRKLGRTAIY